MEAKSKVRRDAVERAHKRFQEFPHYDPEEMTATEAVRRLLPDIHALQAKGYSLDSIAGFLSEEGIAMSGAALKALMRHATAKKKRPTARRSLRRPNTAARGTALAGAGERREQASISGKKEDAGAREWAPSAASGSAQAADADAPRRTDGDTKAGPGAPATAAPVPTASAGASRDPESSAGDRKDGAGARRSVARVPSGSAEALGDSGRRDGETREPGVSTDPRSGRSQVGSMDPGSGPSQSGTTASPVAKGSADVSGASSTGAQKEAARGGIEPGTSVKSDVVGRVGPKEEPPPVRRAAFVIRKDTENI